jgi:hypothetical protein
MSSTEIDRLRALRSADSAVLSVYLNVPVDLADHHGLLIMVRDLIRDATQPADAPQPGGRPAADQAIAAEEDAEAIVSAVRRRSQEWLGYSVALFACAEIGLAEALPVHGPLPERAVAAHRPYTRPLLAAVQRNPAYRVALIDARHAWILAITDGQIETVGEQTGAWVASTGFAGWYGLDAYRTQQKIITFARQHYRDTVTILERSTAAGPQPIVLGGHEDEINQFIAVLPRAIRQDIAGSFRVDLQTTSPARARELAAPVIQRWTEASEAALVRDVLNDRPEISATTDLTRCLQALRVRAVAHLLLGDDQIIPGFGCDNCGALTTGPGCDCPDPAAACRAVPDLLDEMANRALDGGSQVTMVRNPPFTAAARLRFPVAAQVTGLRSTANGTPPASVNAVP